MKALVTRAGPGTKMICLGNIAQIDTPYLTETTSGLTYVVNRFQRLDVFGAISPWFVASGRVWRTYASEVPLIFKRTSGQPAHSKELYGSLNVAN